MSPLFRSKPAPVSKGRTLLILDIENGSAASALLRLSPGEQPKLFAERRIHTPLPMHRSAALLASEVEKAATAALHHAAEVAARVRNHESSHEFGTVESAVVFLAPPWGTPNLADGKPTFLEGMTSFANRAVDRSFGRIPTGFYTSAGSSAFGTKALLTNEPCIVCAVSGEVSEVMRLDEHGVAAHATIPTGLHAYLRTLRTHAGLSEHEARSAMRLLTGHEASRESHLREPVRAAAAEFSAHFKEAVRELLGGESVRKVALVAHESAAERLARALSEDESLTELFPHGGEIRALRAHHATPHIAAHAETPDLHLMLEALFVDSHAL